VLSRDAKRIASRSVIRLATRTAKGGEQRDAILMQTGGPTCSANTVNRPDAVGMAPRGMNCFNRHIALHVALLINNRVTSLVASCLEPRMRMRANSRVNYSLVTRLDRPSGNPINRRLRIRDNMVLANRMGTREVIQTNIPMRHRVGTRVSKDGHRRASIRCESWTGNRVSSYYGRYDSARRDSARRHAEGRER